MCPQRRVDADDLRIGLAVGQAGIAVEGIAANAGGVRQRLAIPLLEQHSDGQVKRLVPFTLQIIEQLLDPRLVRDRRVCVGLRGGRLGRVLAAQAMDMVELFGRLVVGLELRRS